MDGVYRNLLIFALILIVPVHCTTNRGKTATDPTPCYPITATPEKNKYFALQDELSPARASVHDAASVDHYTNEWVIEVPGGEGEARAAAEALGHEFLREMHGFKHFFLIRKRNHPEQNESHSHHITQQLQAHVSITSAEQQVAKHREKRNIAPFRPPLTSADTTDHSSTDHEPEALAEVLEEIVPLAELHRRNEIERAENKRNQERTKDILTQQRDMAVKQLIKLIADSGQPLQSLIDYVKQTADNIEGVNVEETKEIILQQLKLLQLTRNPGMLAREMLSQPLNSIQELIAFFSSNTGYTGDTGKTGGNDESLRETGAFENEGSHLERRSTSRNVLSEHARPRVVARDGTLTAGSSVAPSLAQMVTYTLEIGSDKSFGPSRYSPVFNDEKWNAQWYLQDFRVGPELLEKPINDLNVVPVYLHYELSGQGVRIVVPDDGLEHDHEDLRENYDPSISYDLNGNDNDPKPRMTDPPRNVHGTRCAGVIAMVANNRKCGAGIAFRAKVGGIRMLDGVSTDRVEGEALKFKHYWVDIYSNSWGPKDDGKTLDPLGFLTTRAMVHGITESRHGRGALYVFAAGNGKDKGDTCSCDGYVSSIFSIVVATCDRYGHVSPYSERCGAIIATAFSAGLNGHNVVTTDVNNGCTQNHTGTSAAAPLVAGILGLLLEANPLITWRDAQHLIIWTAEVAPLADNYGWELNGFGFLVSHDFGFGMVNAFNMITAARSWTNVPESNICAVPVEIGGNSILRSSVASQFEILTDACSGHQDGEVSYLEHVQLNVHIDYPVRGHLQIVIISPMGTRSHLLESRPSDNSSGGFIGWTFSTLHFWGETPRGLWIVQVFDVNGGQKDGEIHNIKLILHGTRIRPPHYATGPRSYDPFDIKLKE